MERNFRNYWKVQKFAEKKNAKEERKIYVKKFLKIKCYTEEELDAIRKRQSARSSLSSLIQKQIIGDNNINSVREELKKLKIIQELFNLYNINIDKVSEKDNDTLFEILRKI